MHIVKLEEVLKSLQTEIESLQEEKEFFEQINLSNAESFANEKLVYLDKIFALENDLINQRYSSYSKSLTNIFIHSFITHILC